MRGVHCRADYAEASAEACAMLTADAQSELRGLKHVCIQQVKDKLAASQAAGSCSNVALKPCDSPYHPDSHQHTAALISTISSQANSGCSSSSKAAVLTDSPFQPTTKAHVAELANAVVSRTSSVDAHTPTNTPVLEDYPFQPTPKSHVAQLASRLSGQLQGDSSICSNSKPTDSPFRTESSSHVSGLISAYKQAVDKGSSSQLRQQVQPRTPDNTPHVATTESTSSRGPFAAYRPKLVGPDEPIQSPDIIHISYGKQAPYQARSSQVAQLADRFAAAKAADKEVNYTKHLSVGSTAQSMSAGATGPESTIPLTIRASCVQPAQRPLPVPPPPTPMGANQRVRAPRHKPQVAAARVSSKVIEGAKARLSGSAACECSGADVANKVSNYPEATAATEDNFSGDGSSLNPLYDPCVMGPKFVPGSKRLSASKQA